MAIDRVRLRLSKLQISVLVACFLCIVITGCVTESRDAAKRDVIGPYKTWDEVIGRWIGGRVPDM